jgi:signal peptidase II
MVLKKSLKNVTKNRNVNEFKSKKIKIKGYYNTVLFIILILIDRLTKVWITASGNKDYGIIAFTYTINTGAGFSILSGMNGILAIIAAIAIAAIIYFHEHIPRFSAITIISGIAGNLTDRIFYGGVIDFINLKFWPIFNIADSLIVIGVTYWIILILMDEYSSKARKSKKSR